MAKQLLFDEEARKKLLSGIEKASKAVKTTLGPCGRTVMLDKNFGAPTITKDGVSVAKELSLKDPYENMGVQLLKEVASKTNDDAGDGTTTSTVLAYAIVKEGMKSVAAGITPIGIKRGIDKAVSIAVKSIKEQSRSVKNTADVEHVATVSANNDSEIGKLIAHAVEAVGKDGVITVEEGKNTETSVNIVEGMEFDRGYVSPYFVNNVDRFEVNYNDAYVLCTDKKISTMKEILPLLEKVSSSGKPLLMIVDDIDGEALATLIVNAMRQTLKVVAVKAPGFGDRRKDNCQDIAILTGGTFIASDAGVSLEMISLEQLGTVQSLKVNKDSTVLVGGEGDKKEIEKRVSIIKNQIKESSSDYDKEALQQRLAKLAGGVAVIEIGALTEVELKEKKFRVEDTLAATRAALEEGVVQGGGMALIKASAELKLVDGMDFTEDEKVGFKIVRRALEEPIRQIAENAGVDGSIVAAKAVEKNNKLGFNAATQEWVDLLEAGIIDPAKVTRSALQNAASVASLLLTTECIITNEETEETSQPQMGMM